ncbi:hypothetical protein PG996_012927 [Apiospora saccharicola]|uniref:DUF6604 domain-containing protein n=1 Tax=Apiospora saccharicola TaxID=335842 RepID=A0ABR1U416_9PEZI
MTKINRQRLYQTSTTQTDIVAIWLKDTAKEFGYEAEHGMLREQAGSRRMHKLKSADFIHAAEYIAKTDPSFEVPPHVTTALNEAIRFRQMAVDNHGYFIDILKSVWWVFERRSNKGNIWAMFVLPI